MTTKRSKTYAEQPVPAGTLKTIRAINWSHGAGDLLSIDTFDGRKGLVTVKRTSCRPTQRIFTVEGDEVTFCGRTRKISAEG